MPEFLYLTIVYTPMALLVLGVFVKWLFKLDIRIMLMGIMSLEFAFWELFNLVWEQAESYYKALCNELGFSSMVNSFFYWITGLGYLVIAFIAIKIADRKGVKLFSYGYAAALCLAIVGGVSFSSYGSDTLVYRYYQWAMSWIMLYLIIVAAKDGYNGRGKRINSGSLNFNDYPLADTNH